MTVYTKKGDQGNTDLIHMRVSKSNSRINLIGHLDEVMVILGKLISQQNPKDDILMNQLKSIYKDFFIIQSKIADINNQFKIELKEKKILELEESINDMELQLPKLKNFIYYTGHSDSILAQEMRVKIRGVERLAVTLSEKEDVEPITLMYLNRVSDYFYTLGRYFNYLNEVEEEIIKL